MSYGDVFPHWMDVYLELVVFLPERWSWQSNTRLTWTPCWPTGRSSCRNLAGRRTIRDSCTMLKGWVIDTVCCTALIDASCWDGVFFQGYTVGRGWSTSRWTVLMSSQKNHSASCSEKMVCFSIKRASKQHRFCRFSFVFPVSSGWGGLGQNPGKDRSGIVQREGEGRER